MGFAASGVPLGVPAAANGILNALRSYMLLFRILSISGRIVFDALWAGGSGPRPLFAALRRSRRRAVAGLRVTLGAAPGLAQSVPAYIRRMVAR